MGGIVIEGSSKTQFVCEDQESLLRICGAQDRNLELIASRLGVEILHRGDTLAITAKSSEKMHQALDMLQQLRDIARNGKEFSGQDLRYALDTLVKNGTVDVKGLFSELVCLTFRGKPVRARTARQRAYLRAMNSNTIIFGIGPAGTGKTYLAVCEAVKQLKNGSVSRIILVRPAVEAGENLGFLPGDLREKVEPYLRPLYDAFF